MRSTTHRSRLLAATAATVIGVSALAACSGSGSGDSSAAGGSGTQSLVGQGGTEPAPADGSAKSDLAAPDRAAAGTTSAVDPAIAERKVTRRADLSLAVEDVQRAAQRVRDIATTEGGLVVSEDISSDPGAPAPVPMEGDTASTPPRTVNGTITVSVPAEKLDATLTQLAEVGVVVSRHTSTDDVTSQYVDTESRLASARSSVERVRALMSQATKLADVVTLEAELSRREADLEALESQLTALKGQVALSPVTVRLATSADALPQPEPTGFLAGLSAGWAAFAGSVTVLLTVLGAVLPFALVAAVVLVPAWLWWRRRTPHRAATSVTPPAAPTS
jgi:hypothetical protein